MLIGNQEGQSTMAYSSPWDYLNNYTGLRDGYYEYYINGEHYSLITHWCATTGPWVRVVEVDWNNNHHCSSDAVVDIKPHDTVINSLLSKQKYNCKAVVEKFKDPTNTWLQYPHVQYIQIQTWNSEGAVTNNCISLDYNSEPRTVNTQWDVNAYNFGTSQGDQYFAYGHSNKPGFVQDFSGAGKGAVYVR